MKKCISKNTYMVVGMALLSLFSLTSRRFSLSRSQFISQKTSTFLIQICSPQWLRGLSCVI